MLVTRIASLACLSASDHTSPLIQQWLAEEYPCIRAKLQPFIGSDLEVLLGSLHPMPEDMRPSSVSRRLMRLFHSLALSDLKQKLPTAHPLLDWKWQQHGGGETVCPQPLSGAWLSAMPAGPYRCLPNACFQWALRQWLAVPTSCSAGICQAVPLGSNLVCAKLLDRWQHHPMVCALGERAKRHNQFRDAMAAFARTANIHAMIEQRTSHDIMAEHSDTPLQPRPVHTADLHLSSPNGAQTWIDVRITTSQHHRDIPSQLHTSVKQKLREYGLAYAEHDSLHDRLVPCIVDCFGVLDRDAYDVLQFLYSSKVTYLVGNLGSTPAVASLHCRADLWQPLSCVLLRSAWRMHCLSAGTADCLPCARPQQAFDVVM